MNKKQLLILAANSKELKEYCFKLCNKRDIYNDLFQEFLLVLCELDEQTLITKYNNIQFIGYCFGIIRQMNLNRQRGCKIKGKENVLVENYSDNLINFETIIDETEYNYDIDVKFEKTIKFLEDTKQVKKYQCSLLFNSLNMTTREIAEKIGANHRQVIYENDKLKKLIKQNIK